MSTKLITVNPGDKLKEVKAIFDENSIHHIPVVRYKQMVGLISKTDFLHFMRGFSQNQEDRFVDEARLRAYTAEEIMTKGIAKLAPSDRISVALELFLVNRFHAIPVVENDELVGILTTFDVIRAISKEDVSADQVIDSQKS